MSEPIRDAARPISQVIPEVQFYPECERVKFAGLKGKEIVITDAKMITYTSKKYGTHPSALLCIVEGDKQFTTICSGEVICEKVIKLISEKAFPVKGTVDLVKGKYWNIL